MAESVSNNAGVTIIPALTGLGAPLEPGRKRHDYWTNVKQQSPYCASGIGGHCVAINDIIELIRKECPNIEFNTLWWMAVPVPMIGSCNAKRMYLNSLYPPPSVEATALGAAYVRLIMPNQASM